MKCGIIPVIASTALGISCTSHAGPVSDKLLPTPRFLVKTRSSAGRRQPDDHSAPKGTPLGQRTTIALRDQLALQHLPLVKRIAMSSTTVSRCMWTWIIL
jgi:hypothetical protein